MKKRIFWSQGHSEIPCNPCPFVGVTVDSWEDFIETVLKDRIANVVDREKHLGWYPPVRFSTKDMHLALVFCGHRMQLNNAPINPSTNKPYKWALIDDRNLKVVKYYNAQCDGEEMYNLFKDDEEVQRMIDTISNKVKENGGIAVEIR